MKHIHRIYRFTQLYHNVSWSGVFHIIHGLPSRLRAFDGACFSLACRLYRPCMKTGNENMSKWQSGKGNKNAKSISQFPYNSHKAGSFDISSMLCPSKSELSSLPQSILTRWASCCCKNALELDGSFPGFGTKESRKGAELAKSPNSQLQCPLFAFNPDFDITIRNYLHVLRTFHTLSPQPMFSRFLSCSVGIARL